MSYLFIGSTIQPVTVAGQIPLPFSYAETTRQRGQDGRIFVGFGADARCLVAYDRSVLAQQQRDHEVRRAAMITPGIEVDQASLRRMFGFVEQAPIGRAGTLVLPAMLRERADIGSSVLLVGMGDRFEIWGVETLIESGPPELRMLANMHLNSLGEGTNHELDLQHFEPRRVTRRGAQPGIHVQHLSAVRPRHDRI